MAKTGVDDIQTRLVRSEREPVWAYEVVRDNREITTGRVDAIDMVSADFAFGWMTLVVVRNAVPGVSEPDGSVRAHHHVVRTVQTFGLVVVGQDRDRTIVLRTRNPTVPLLARHKASLTVNGVAICKPRGVAKNADLTVRLIPTKKALVWYVAPHEVAPSREIGGAFGLAATRVQDLDILVPAAAGEAVVHGFEVGLDHVFSCPTRLAVQLNLSICQAVRSGK